VTETPYVFSFSFLYRSLFQADMGN